MAVWLAGWQHTDRPAVERPVLVVAAGDHGVAGRGVTPYPSSATATVVEAIRAGVATSAVMGRSVGASVVVVDAGVGRPSGDLVVEPALPEGRWAELVAIGRGTVAGLDTDLLLLGEMGIGNTTAASAVAAALFGGPVSQWVGRGSGLDEAGLEVKRSVVEQARLRVGSAPPLEILRQLGGAELAVLAGACVEARSRSTPVLLDGFVVTAAVAPLAVAMAGALDHCLAAHLSPEPGHRRLLDRLGMLPLLDLEMRLGEGTGALAALPLVRLAAASAVEVATLGEWDL